MSFATHRRAPARPKIAEHGAGGTVLAEHTLTQKEAHVAKIVKEVNRGVDESTIERQSLDAIAALRNLRRFAEMNTRMMLNALLLLQKADPAALAKKDYRGLAKAASKWVPGKDYSKEHLLSIRAMLLRYAIAISEANQSQEART